MVGDRDAENESEDEEKCRAATGEHVSGSAVGGADAPHVPESYHDACSGATSILWNTKVFRRSWARPETVSPAELLPESKRDATQEISRVSRPSLRHAVVLGIASAEQPLVFEERDMDKNDKTAIEALFGKLDEVERQAPPRDADSETFIHERIRRQPGAPYFMAQTIIVQDQALRSAQERIAELEAQPVHSAQPSSRAARAPTSGMSVPRIGAAAGSQRGGGGFLAGAAQTAMGVAGGLLLGNALAGMFGSSDAAAAESAHGAQDTSADDAGFEDDGDFGDMEF